MKSGIEQAKRAASATAQVGHNGGPNMIAQRLYEIIGPRLPSIPPVFDCGAPWTAHATDDELRRLGKVQGRIARREEAIRELRRERKTIMMRCIRRMRRKKEVE